MQIDSIEKWAEVAEMLAKDKFDLWQTQYSIDNPYGFIATFDNFKASKRLPTITIITFDQAVHDAVLRYTLPRE
jgi:hypothetical protein